MVVNVVQSCTKLYKVVQQCAELGNGRQSFAKCEKLCRVVQRCAKVVSKIMQRCTKMKDS